MVLYTHPSFIVLVLTLRTWHPRQISSRDLQKLSAKSRPGKVF